MTTAAKQISNIVAELQMQGWEVTKTTDGQRWRAKPPSADRKIVTFSAYPPHGTSVTLILRDLKHQGFAWPTPDRPKPPPEPRHSAAPFLPKPHPDATIGDDESPPEAPQTNGVSHSESVDPLESIFVQLKEARLYAALAREERDKRLREFDEAKRRLDAAEEELARAEADRNEKKEAFDACLEQA